MISIEELDKIEQLRCTLQPDLLTTAQLKDDHFLIRWLRARNLDVDKASDMLTKSIKWRKENNIDDILEKGEDIPLKYRRIFPTGVVGRDAYDCLVTLVPLGRINQRVLIESEGLETAVRYNIIWMEKMMKRVKDTEEKLGKKGLRFVEIVDMEHYSYRQLAYGPERELMLRTNKLLDENYPEVLKTILFINAPRVFALLFNMLRPFLSAETLGKVQIYSHDEETWKKVIQENFSLDNIPKRWGGTREGSDEFCSQDKEVWPDAPIPLSFFTNTIPQAEVKDVTKSECIGARDYFQVDVCDIKSIAHVDTRE